MLSTSAHELDLGVEVRSSDFDGLAYLQRFGTLILLPSEVASSGEITLIFGVVIFAPPCQATSIHCNGIFDPVSGKMISESLQRRVSLTLPRLNMQHWLFTRDKALIHSSIPVQGLERIADVGTGTGVWLLDLARLMPESTTFVGLDLEMAQVSPPAWLPKNVTMQRLDIYGEIPQELQKSFGNRFGIIALSRSDFRSGSVSRFKATASMPLSLR